MQARTLASLLLALGLAAVAAAHEYSRGAIFVDHPWTPAAGSGAEADLYFAIENRGDSADRLVAASTPRARAVELRRGARRLETGIELAAGARIELESGPYRVVLIGPATPLSKGQHFPLRLRFENAGEIEAEVHVEPRRPAGG